jgi:hypothetical protein
MGRSGKKATKRTKMIAEKDLTAKGVARRLRVGRQ